MLWLKSKKNMTETDLNKLWKGLFYCHWHSDKAMVQAELAHRLSKIFLDLRPCENTQLMYFQACCFILRREWFGIDKLRMDKFLLLVRYVANSLFSYFSLVDWDENIVSKYVNFIESQVLLDKTVLTAKGFSSQIYDVFVDEIVKGVLNGAGKRPRKETWSQLLTPFVKVMVTGRFSEARRVAESIFEEIFSKFEKQQDMHDLSGQNGIISDDKNSVSSNKKDMPKNQDGEYTEQEKDLSNGDLIGKKRKNEDGSQQNGQTVEDDDKSQERWVFEGLDFFWLAEWLFQSGSDEKVQQVNREVLYDLSGQAERVAKKFKRIKNQGIMNFKNENQHKLDKSENIVQSQEKLEPIQNKSMVNGVQNGTNKKKQNKNNNENQGDVLIGTQNGNLKYNNKNNNYNQSQVESFDEIQSDYMLKTQNSSSGKSAGKQNRALERRIAKLKKLKLVQKIKKTSQQKQVQKQQQQQKFNLNTSRIEHTKQKFNTKQNIQKQRSEKQLRWSMKKNLVHKYGEPAPPEDVRSPPGTKPKGSALRKTYS
eukprot:TRINITY_DN5505_c0_g1_i3.p1 TRINITY_DN5505_c0_g1~~TRINITY_DN5505_c0_g1_i3.p1  ORF type:complete len:536 (-),score=78.00 TRINITY_DN5505_c0_g1_i3:2198-3805(-)